VRFLEKVLSASEQDYLKNIYALTHESGRATTLALAERLGVKAPSVTAMIKHLADDPDGPYVSHTPYQGIELTERGTAVALEVVRHHRLLELFLATQLDVPWDRVHAEAERLEHVISEDLEERIAAKLGYPTRDPHGDPIPRRDGTLDDAGEVPLSAMGAGSSGIVARVPDEETALLQYLDQIGLVPGVTVVIETITPYGDVMSVRVGDDIHALGVQVTSRVRVLPAHDHDRSAAHGSKVSRR